MYAQCEADGDPSATMACLSYQHGPLHESIISVADYIGPANCIMQCMHTVYRLGIHSHMGSGTPIVWVQHLV